MISSWANPGLETDSEARLALENLDQLVTKDSVELGQRLAVCPLKPLKLNRVEVSRGQSDFDGIRHMPIGMGPTEVDRIIRPSEMRRIQHRLELAVAAQLFHDSIGYRERILSHTHSQRK